MTPTEWAVALAAGLAAAIAAGISAGYVIGVAWEWLDRRHEA